jgi:hypothetical protein
LQFAVLVFTSPRHRYSSASRTFRESFGSHIQCAVSSELVKRWAQPLTKASHSFNARVLAVFVSVSSSLRESAFMDTLPDIRRMKQSRVRNFLCEPTAERRRKPRNGRRKRRRWVTCYYKLSTPRSKMSRYKSEWTYRTILFQYKRIYSPRIQVDIEQNLF